MNGEEIVSVLKDLGFDTYQSKIYYNLVLSGPLKARELALKSGVPMPRVYDALENLMKKNLVEVLLDTPKMYKAVPAEIAFKNLLAERQKSLQQLEVLVNNVSKFLKPMKTEVVGGVWASKNKTWIAFFNKAAEMVNRAEKYVFGLTREYTRSPLLRQALKNAAKRKVKVCILGLSKPNEENSLRIKWYKKHGCDVRWFEAKIHPRIIDVDGKEIFLRLDHNPSKREGFETTSLWSADPSLVKVFDSYVKGIWQKAKRINFKGICSAVSIAFFTTLPAILEIWMYLQQLLPDALS